MHDTQKNTEKPGKKSLTVSFLQLVNCQATYTKAFENSGKKVRDLATAPQPLDDKYHSHSLRYALLENALATL